MPRATLCAFEIPERRKRPCSMRSEGPSVVSPWSSRAKSHRVGTSQIVPNQCGRTAPPSRLHHDGRGRHRGARLVAGQLTRPLSKSAPLRVRRIRVFPQPLRWKLRKRCGTISRESEATEARRRGQEPPEWRKRHRGSRQLRVLRLKTEEPACSAKSARWPAIA